MPMEQYRICTVYMTVFEFRPARTFHAHHALSALACSTLQRLLEPDRIRIGGT